MESSINPVSRFCRCSGSPAMVDSVAPPMLTPFLLRDTGRLPAVRNLELPTAVVSRNNGRSISLSPVLHGAGRHTSKKVNKLPLTPLLLKMSPAPWYRAFFCSLRYIWAPHETLFGRLGQPRDPKHVPWIRIIICVRQGKLG